jgi:hypothetical protein
LASWVSSANWWWGSRRACCPRFRLWGSPTAPDVDILHGSAAYGLQAAIFVLWTAGVPAVAGLRLALPWLTRAGEGGLALATANASNALVRLLRLWKQPAIEPGPV